MSEQSQHGLGGIDEYSPGIEDPARGLFRTYKETPTTRFGGQYQPLIFTEGQRQEMAKLASLDIDPPDGFELSLENIKRSIEAVSQIEHPSLIGLLESGMNVEGVKEFAEVDVRNIVGVAGEETWEGLVQDTPPHAILENARYDLSLGYYGRKRLIEDEFELWAHKKEDGSYLFGVESGQHRVLTFKLLSAMGCRVTLRNIKVKVLK